MDGGAAVEAEVLDPPPTDDEGVGDQPAVAAPPDGLGAHDRRRRVRRRGLEIRKRSLELIGAHVIRIPLKGPLMPPAVAGSRNRDAPTAELREVAVADPG